MRIERGFRCGYNRKGKCTRNWITPSIKTFSFLIVYNLKTFCNCISLENFLQLYTIWKLFTLSPVHDMAGYNMWGLPIKAGLARALKSSIFLSGSVIVSHLRRRNTSKQFSQLSDRKWSCQMLIVGWQVWLTYLSSLSSSPTICRDQTAAQLNLHSDNVKIFWRQPLRQNYVETRAVAI